MRVSAKAARLDAPETDSCKGRCIVDDVLKRRIAQRLPFLRLLVRYTQNFFDTCIGFIYDAARFIRYSAPRWTPRNAAHFEAMVTLEYHAIEKGLSLKEPRLGFGKRRISDLASMIRTYTPRYSMRPQVHQAINALHEYQGSHGENPDIAGLATQGQVNRELGGGTKQVSRTKLLSDAHIDLRAFFESRHSIRHFATEEVDIGMIESAVRMAMKTPSVCNRQAWRVHVMSERADIEQALRYQNGNAGFGNQASKLLVLTCDIRRFTSAGERFQYWIDGGMFGMSMVYALHSLGLGTCCLNMSTTSYRDRAFRKAIGLPGHEAVIMMIAVGHLPEDLRVPQSPKRDIAEVMEVH